MKNDPMTMQNIFGLKTYAYNIKNESFEWATE